MKKLLFFIFFVLFSVGCREVEHRLEFQDLTVVDSNEYRWSQGHGDEIMLGTIYFTSQFGVAGSSRVQSLPVQKIASNVRTGRSIGRDRTSRFDFNWNTFKQSASDGSTRAILSSYSQTLGEFISSRVGPSIEGAIVVAVEEDGLGSRKVNDRFNTVVNDVLQGLQRYIESSDYASSAGNFGLRADYFGDMLLCFKLFAESGADCNSSGALSGGGDWTNLFFPLNRVLGAILGSRAHDLIGQSVILYIGVDKLTIDTVRSYTTDADTNNDGQDDLLVTTSRIINGLEQGNQMTTCGGSVIANLHVCNFETGGNVSPLNADINLYFRGEGALWTLQVNHRTEFIN